MLDRLEVVLRGCVGKSGLNSSLIVSLDYHCQALEQEGNPMLVISKLSDVPSQLAQEFDAVAVNVHGGTGSFNLTQYTQACCC